MRTANAVFMAVAVALAAAILVGCNATKQAAGSAETTQKVCPVTGDPIDKSFYTDYQGQRVYFCCADCIKLFKANPEKYTAKLKGKPSTEAETKPTPQEGEHKHEGGEGSSSKASEPPSGTTAIAQKTCPVMGGAIDKNIYTDYKGRRVYFCCPMCISTFKKDPEKYLAKLDQKTAGTEESKGADVDAHGKGHAH